MNPLKKLHSALICVALALGLVTGLSGTASATNYRIVDWDISRITDGGQEHAARYYHAVDGLHQNTYGNATHENAVMQTTTDRSRIVQIRIRDTGGNELVSLYFWADNLYLAGFYAPYGGDAGSGRHHFSFADGRDMAASLGVGTRSPVRTGNYTSLPGGNNRENLRITPATLYNAAYVLGHATGYNDSVGASLLLMIQAFSEAARFGPIFSQVYNNIYNHNETPLGRDLAGLENQWDEISRFAHDVRRNGSSYLDLFGHTVRNFNDLRTRLSFVEVMGSVAQL
ncbi:ribosome-inactivating family protein [Kitasatospora sp. NPDC048194]|uniref:ribosome-inactivating family protein n=1 Tax=Kitasatospora sp. NPDC048194 TaxID=3364045 RepID=UPI003721D4D8